MKTANAFKYSVYKDQTNSANRGKMVEVGDTVTLVIRNAAGTPTTQDVTVTAVLNSGKDVQWDNGTTGNLRSVDVIRVHAKHNYQCPGRQTYQATLTELNPTTVPMAVTSISLNGIPYAVGVAEASAANGITPQFVIDLTTKINQIIGIEGYCTGVVTGSAGTQVLTLKMAGLTFVWTGISTAGATVVGPSLV